MNKIIISFFFVLIFNINLFNYAYSQTIDNNEISFIYAVSVVRNSDGDLVSYLETSRIKIVDPEMLNNILDYEVNFGGKNVVITEFNGVQHEWIKFSRPQTFNENTVRSTTALGDIIDGQPKLAAIFTHDGYSIAIGDELTIMWTVARPIE